jgi:hypothetical protein
MSINPSKWSRNDKILVAISVAGFLYNPIGTGLIFLGLVIFNHLWKPERRKKLFDALK